MKLACALALYAAFGCSKDQAKTAAEINPVACPTSAVPTVTADEDAYSPAATTTSDPTSRVRAWRDTSWCNTVRSGARRW